MLTVEHNNVQEVEDVFLSEDDGERIMYFNAKNNMTVRFLGIPIYRKKFQLAWDTSNKGLRIDGKEVKDKGIGF